MSDEHQSRAMGCAIEWANTFEIKTPNLDRLAKRGMRFTNAYTPSPICVPARAAFATGRHVHQNRLWDNAMPYTGSIPGWGHALQRKGVSVESIGKLHYRAEEDPAGFDEEHIPMMVAGGVGMVWASIRKEDERVYGPKRMLGDYIGPGESKYTEYDAAVTERTIQWLKENPSDPANPWCLYVGMVAPHFPLVVPEEFFNLYPAGSVPEPKLHPDAGHPRHPWVEKQNAFMNSEAKFADADERGRALSSYYGLCTFLDHNIGRILDTLDALGLTENTTIVYTSDHGDNVGARGLWGKSNMYEESAAIPLIMTGPDIGPGTCDTPVDLLDLSMTIAAHFNCSLGPEAPGRNLREIATARYNPERVIFSQYHAAGAVSGAYMIRKGDWKYIHYVGFEPELFNLRHDPQETNNLAGNPESRLKLNELHAELIRLCDPDDVDRMAFEDQATLIESHGGREAALRLGAPGATPPPEVRT